MKVPSSAAADVISTEYEASVARYWNEKRHDPINVLLGEKDGLIHHHYGVGEFDRSVLELPPPIREESILSEMHRLENHQVDLILDSLEDLRPDARVLDAGSGRGGTSLMVHNRFGCFVDGITISSYQVDFSRYLAERRGCAGNVRFHFQNMLRTEFAESSFDAIVTNETTMYVDLFELYREFARIIKTGGRYVFITWCISDAVDAASPDVAEIDRHYGCRMHPRSDYFAALAQNGFAPYQVADLTKRAIPYWELRTHSEHRTGIEDAFLAAYHSGAMTFLLAGAHHVPGA